MKFVKGVMVGGIITTGIVMMCSDSCMNEKKRLMKKGAKMLKKMGI